MPQVYLTPTALEDFDENDEFSKDNWREEVADKYKSDLEAALNKLGFDPEAGRIKEQYSEDYPALSVRNHVIIYQYEKSIDAVIILNILNGSWNVKKIVNDRAAEIKNEIAFYIDKVQSGEFDLPTIPSNTRQNDKGRDRDDDGGHEK